MTFYSDIKFKQAGNYFQHNLDSDFILFALWKSARPYQDRIRKYFLENFEILAETEIIWSKENFNENSARLYEAVIRSNISKENRESGHEEKIGGKSFIIFILKDNNPKYTYAQSVSKKIELSNLNVVEVKSTIRSWIEKDTGIPFGVHSTNNIQEFFFQVPLLLGTDRFKKLLAGEKLQESKLEKDLEGAEGWRNYEELFEVLNFTCNYSVLRGFETLPAENEDKDIDFLTDNFQRLASSLNARQYPSMPYKGFIYVGNEKINIDLRFIGDKYYHPVWQKEILETKELYNGIYIPRKDQYFYSLLHHCKVQKFSVKPKYIGILEVIAKDLNFNWYSSNLIENNDAIGKILKGFYQSHGYYYENPIDPGVGKNKAVFKYLTFNETIVPERTTKQKIKDFLWRNIPESIIVKIKKIMRR